MELEILNEEYNYLNEVLKNTKSDVDYLKEKLMELKQDKIIYQAEYIRAGRSGDPEKIKKAEEDVKKVNDRIKYMKGEADKKLKRTVALQHRIDGKIDEIRRDPEIGGQIDIALTKRYERGIKKANTEKEEEIKNKKKVTDFKDVISNHPSLQNNVKGILTASVLIKNFEKELKSLENPSVNGQDIEYKDPAKATELQTKIQQATEKGNKNYLIIVEFARKNGINIDDIISAVNKIIENGPVLSSKDPNNISVDVMASFAKSEQISNKKIKGYNKQIARYEIGLNEINGWKQNNIEQTEEQTQMVTAEKPKWYQFIKRFKIWNYQRQQSRLNDYEATNQENTDNTNQFTDSLKWGVVRDAMNIQQKEDMKIANKIMKENPEEYNINDLGDRAEDNEEDR